MLKQIKILNLIISSAILFSSTCFASTNDPWVENFSNQFQNSYSQSNSGVVSKDQWADRAKTVIPNAICQKFSANKLGSELLKSNQLDSEKCASIIATQLSQCIANNTTAIPAELDKANQVEWNRKMGQCAINIFLTQYGKVPQTDWIAQVKAKAPITMCEKLMSAKNSSDLLTANQIDTAKCETLIPKTLDQCIVKAQPTMPASIDISNDGEWSNQIGKCTAVNFLREYGRISKTAWFEQVKTKAPTALCQKLTSDEKTNKNLALNHIDLSKCEALMPDSIDRCATNFAPTMPAQISMANESEWAKKMVTCTIKDFYYQNIASSAEGISKTGQK